MLSAIQISVGKARRLRSIFKINTLTLSIAMLLSCPWRVQADNYFNPAFLAADPAAVADLSQFEKGNSQAPGHYRVDVYINERRFDTIDVNFSKAGGAKTNDDTGLKPDFTARQLQSLGVNIDAFEVSRNSKPDEIIDFTALIPDSSTEFDFANLRLKLNIPQAALLNNARGYIPPAQWDQGINALLLNYSFTGANSRDSSPGGQSNSDYYLALNGGANLGAWRLRNFSTWRYSGENTDGSKSDWQHISTYVQRTIIPLKGELTMGDSYTSADIFDSISFRGVELASDDNMLPDSLKGFAPVIHGIAKSNAQVTIKQNGYAIYQSYVPPGAFTINDLFPTSSSGDLTVEIKEDDGAITSYSVPYSAVPMLQREGRLKYDLVAARYRPGSGDQEEVGFGSGTLIWGLPYGLTAYGGIQAAADYNAYAIGAGLNMGEIGAVSADLTVARSRLADESEHHGVSWRFLYAKSLVDTGTDFQLIGYRYSTSGYYTLEDTTYKRMSGYYSDDLQDDDRPRWMDYYNLGYTKKGKLQVNISQQFGDYGSFYISGSEQTYWNSDDKDKLLQIGYNSQWRQINFGVSYNYSLSAGQPEADQIFAFNLSLPLGQWLPGGNNPFEQKNNAYATYLLNSDRHGKTTQNAGLSGTLLENSNLNYNITEGYGNHDTGNSGNASLSYEGTYGNANIGYNYSDNADYQQVNYGLSGGIVAHRNGVTFSQPLGDTNVLIAVPGAGGINIENSAGVRTDWRGYTVLPYATVYRENRIALDLNSVGDDVDVDEAVASVVPTKGALVRADFKARVGARALITLRRGRQYVPFGAMVGNAADDSAGIVGDKGQVYMSGLAPNGELHVQWGEGAQQRCHAEYDLPAIKTDGIIVKLSANCR